MNVIAVNGGPRKNRNTATLLGKALEGAQSVGADTELIHLYDLTFKGCRSCLECKLKGNKHLGICLFEDGLSDSLRKISKCDVLLLGSPIYISAITGVMHSFLERLFFPALTYNAGHGSVFQGKISSCFFYAMGAPEERAKTQNYEAIFQFNEMRLKTLHGTSEYLASYNTYQFDDYSKYEASMFDEKSKAKIRQEQFPLDCKKAFEIGARLAGIEGDRKVEDGLSSLER
ncbi:MAG: flavodoxin family protein [Rectinemataceae bacterium]